MINKYPYEIETPLDRRAMTIDILAGEIERKNKSIKYWREKAEYHRDKCVEFQKVNEDLQTDWNSVDAICDKKTFEIRALKKEIEKYKLANKYNELPEVKNFYAGRLASHSNVKTTERYAKILDKAESNKRKKKKINGKATENKF